MSENEKVKIKLSELTDMYDIEDDSKDIKHTPEKEDDDWETTIEMGDKELKEELDW